MRLKIFTAKTMQAALDEVREVLGSEAVIMSSEETADGVIVTAATEAPPKVDIPLFGKQRTPIKARKSEASLNDAPNDVSINGARINDAPINDGRFRAIKKKTAPLPAPKLAPSPIRKSLKDLEEEQKFEDEFDLEAFLIHHGTSGSIRQEMMSLFSALDKENNLLCLAAVMESLFSFIPLDNNFYGKPLILVGPPGAGKTVTAAKLASQAVLAGRKCHLISTDVIRTGGFAQLLGYAEVLKIPISKVASAAELKELLHEIKADGELIIIDSAGFNPFHAEEMAGLYEYISAGSLEPIFIAPSGIDPLEAAEMAVTYSALGVTRFIPTRLDVARRYGSLIAVAEAGKMGFAGAGLTPFLAEGIQSLDPLTLAKLLTKIPKAEPFTASPEKQDPPNKKQNRLKNTLTSPENIKS